MKVNWFAIAFIIVVLGVAVSAWPDARAFFWQEHLGPGMTNTSGYGQAKIQFSDTTVIAQVPLNLDLQAKGLAGRTGLKDSEGMIWIYPTAQAYQFWMKDMVIALDFIWIDQGHVVDLTPNVPPPAPGQAVSDLPILEPKVPATTILEVRSGFIANHHVAVGDPVEVDRQ